MTEEEQDVGLIGVEYFTTKIFPGAFLGSIVKEEENLEVEMSYDERSLDSNGTIIPQYKILNNGKAVIIQSIGEDKISVSSNTNDFIDVEGIITAIRSHPATESFDPEEKE